MKVSRKYGFTYEYRVHVDESCGDGVERGGAGFVSSGGEEPQGGG